MFTNDRQGSHAPQAVRRTTQRRPCFYCGRTLRQLDKDHSPVPKRYGGTEIVDACRHCHSLKDRIGFRNWSPSEWEAVVRGTTPHALTVTRYCFAAVQDGSVAIDPALVVEAAAECSTPEARIAVYKALNTALDATKGAVLAVHGTCSWCGFPLPSGGGVCPQCGTREAT